MPIHTAMFPASSPWAKSEPPGRDNRRTGLIGHFQGSYRERLVEYR